MKKNILYLLVSTLCVTACGGSTEQGADNKPETIYQVIIPQQATPPSQQTTPVAAEPQKEAEIVLDDYVSLKGVLNVDNIRFDLNKDYGTEYYGTFTNYKVNVVWNVSGTLTPRRIDLITVGEKSTWTFKATGDGQGNYDGRAQLQGGGGYNFKVHL